MPRASRAAVAAALAVAVAVGAWALWPEPGGTAEAQAPARAVALPAAPPSALRIARPRPLKTDPHLTRWTIVRRPTVARAAPDASAAVLARLTPRTPERTENLLVVLGVATDPHGGVWVHARLPVLPNGTAGWVPRNAVGPYASVTTRLVVSRELLTATLYRDGRVIFRAPVGVGTAAWPTPPGEFAVRSRLTSYRSPFYGPIAFGTTARSAVLTDWPAGGYVGIHGTNEPELLPGHVSHGCIRMRNGDILKLARLLPIGTRLTIE
jgi:lipoprotein-anchoring transpeptidase ErfK/SrfK